MRKRKTVFFDCILSLAICWGLSSFFNHSDKESVLLLAGCLLYICVLILIPIGMATLKTTSSLKGGIYLLLMLLPLVCALSYPLISLTNFHIILEKIDFLSEIKPGVINFIVNGSIFFVTGYTFIYLNKGQSSRWKGVFFTSFLLTSFYALSFYWLYLKPSFI
ncbi:MAG: hypothetical protein CVU87_11145 [Firmicutes bacterium HGW-Firmicutes-12]|jgi:hypothetical protein|nr:MAG: hypothetical protein CVU87_11145 [Firmicutes bacterium HGW-Firmicutes-12]